MNDYAKMFFDEGVEEGIEKGRVEMCADLVKDAMSTNNVSIEEAMEYHHIPLKMRPAVHSYLETGTFET